MSLSRLGPAAALRFIQRCVRERKVLWTYHVNMRMKDRSISRDMVISSVENYEVIEYYPDNKYLPSCLVGWRMGANCFHVLFALDVANDNVRVITAYYPSPGLWSESGQRRKKS